MLSKNQEVLKLNKTIFLTVRLFLAIKEYNIPEIKSLSEQGADFAAHNEDGLTPMQYAVKCTNSTGDWRCVEALVESKPTNCDDTYEYGEALLIAIRYGFHQIAKRLIESNAKTNWFCTYNKYSPLHWSVTKDHSETTKLLIKHNANLYFENTNKEIPVELACSLGHWDSAEILLMVPNFVFKDSAKAGKAYFQALKAGQLPIADKLSRAGASCIEPNPKNGNTPLHYVVNNWKQLENNVALLRFVLEHGFNFAKNKEGKTALELASELGYWDFVNLFIEFVKTQKLPIDVMDYERIFINAIKQGTFNNTKLLLELVSNWNPQIMNTALYWAVMSHYPGIARLLLEHGAQPDLDGSQSIYALVMESNYSDCLKPLLENARKNVHELFTSMMNETKPLETLVNQIKQFNRLYQNIITIEPAISMDGRELVNYQKQYVDKYVNKLAKFLSDIALKIQQSPWQKSYMFILWQDGKPETIQRIQNELNTLSNTPSTNEILNVFTKVISLVKTIKTDNVFVIEFYNSIMKQLEALTFVPSKTTSDESVMASYSVSQPLLCSNVIYSYPAIDQHSMSTPSNYNQHDNIMPIYVDSSFIQDLNSSQAVVSNDADKLFAAQFPEVPKGHVQRCLFFSHNSISEDHQYKVSGLEF